MSLSSPAFTMDRRVPAPLGDPGRLAALHASGLRDTAEHGPLDRLARLTRQLLGADVALLTVVDDSRQYFAGHDGLGAPWAATRQSDLSHSFCQYVVTSAAPFVVDDAHTHPVVADNEAIRDIGVVAYAGVPLVAPDDYVLGSLCAIQRTPRAWSAHDLDLLHELGLAARAEVGLRVAVGAMARERDTLAHERAFLAATLESLTDGVVACDTEGRPVVANRALRTIHGIDDEPLAPDLWADRYALFHADGRPMASDEVPLRRAFLGQDVRDVEMVVAPAGQPPRAIVATGQAIRTADGTRVGAVVAMHDVTARRAAERALHESERARRESEARYRALVDRSPDAVVLHADGVVQYANAAAARLFRVASPAALLGTSIKDHVPGDDRATAVGWARGVLDERASAPPREMQFVRADGTLVDVETTVARLPGPLGNTVQVLIRDVSERRRATEALRASEARLTRIYESASDLMVLMRVERDADGMIADYRCESVNGAYLTATRLQRAQLVGQAAADLLSPADAARVLANYARVATTGEVLHYDESLSLRGGTLVLQTTLSPVTDASGRCTHLVGASRDVTALRRAEAARRESEARYRGLVDLSSDGLLIHRDGIVRHANQSAAALFGVVAPTDLVGQRVLPFIHPEDRATVADQIGILRPPATLPQSGASIRDVRLLRVDGSIAYLELRAGAVPHDGTAGVQVVLRDVTDRQVVADALRASELRFRGVLESIRSPAVQVDVDGRVTFANDALLDLAGWSRAEALGASWYDGFVADGEQTRTHFGAMLGGTTVPAQAESELLTRTGTRRFVLWDHVLVHDAAGQRVGVACIGHDVTERRALEQRLATLSEHDELTGLLNRRGFRRMAAHTLRSAARSGRRDAMLFLDLDAFKPINDTYGHSAGDEALRAVADVLRGTMREADFTGRLGGDEFAICAIGLREGEGHTLAARIRAALDAHNATATANGRRFTIGLSIGIAELEPGDDLDTLLARADAALYAQKSARRGQPGHEAPRDPPPPPG